MQIQDKCSFEWAKKLQDAGYKKPETYEAGQVYYDRVGRPIIIACVFSSGLLQTVNAKTHDGGRVMNVPEGCVYAPGVSELMKQINFGSFFSPSMYYREKHGDFHCDFDQATIRCSRSTNLCDALAEAWIENHKALSDEQI